MEKQVCSSFSDLDNIVRFLILKFIIFIFIYKYIQGGQLLEIKNHNRAYGKSLKDTKTGTLKNH